MEQIDIRDVNHNNNMAVVRETLDNGLKIVIDSEPQRKSVAIRIFYVSGRDYDPIGYEGVNHYLEHLLIENPTKKYSEREQAK